MSGRDAHDIAIMRRELHASRRVDGSMVAHDIRGRRHEANVAAQWTTTRARKHKEAKAKGERFTEAGYLREHLEIGISTDRDLAELVSICPSQGSCGRDWLLRCRVRPLTHPV